MEQTQAVTDSVLEGVVNDEGEVISPIRRSNASFFYDGAMMRQGGAKNPINLVDLDSDDEDDEMEEDIPWGEDPDLAAFFANFPWIDQAAQIAICRTYANHLASVLRVRKRVKAVEEIDLRGE